MTSYALWYLMNTAPCWNITNNMVTAKKSLTRTYLLLSRLLIKIKMASFLSRNILLSSSNAFLFSFSFLFPCIAIKKKGGPYAESLPATDQNQHGLFPSKNPTVAFLILILLALVSLPPRDNSHLPLVSFFDVVTYLFFVTLLSIPEQSFKVYNWGPIFSYMYCLFGRCTSCLHFSHTHARDSLVPKIRN